MGLTFFFVCCIELNVDRMNQQLKKGTKDFRTNNKLYFIHLPHSTEIQVIKLRIDLYPNIGSFSCASLFLLLSFSAVGMGDDS